MDPRRSLTAKGLGPNKPLAKELDMAFDLVRAAARELDLPGLEEGIWLGRPCLRVRGKSIIGSKDGRVLVVHCPFGDKEPLMEARPELYFETDHYKGYPAVLMRPGKVTKAELKRRIEQAWRMHAPKRAVAEHDARGRGEPGPAQRR